jgi:hypothetical protein
MKRGVTPNGPNMRPTRMVQSTGRLGPGFCFKLLASHISHHPEQSEGQKWRTFKNRWGKTLTRHSPNVTCDCTAAVRKVSHAEPPYSQQLLQDSTPITHGRAVCTVASL